MATSIISSQPGNNVNIQSPVENNMQSNVSIYSQQFDSKTNQTLPAALLSDEEEEKYALLKEALSLNILADEKYQRLQKLLTVRLRECRQKLARCSKAIEDVIKIPQQFKFRYCGKPYFRDRNNVPPPENQDSLLFKKSNMYNCIELPLVSDWTVKDKYELVHLLHEMSVRIKKNELNKKIAKLVQENSDKNNSALTLLNIEINLLKMQPLAEIVLPIEMEYDWDEVARKLKGRHTASEYRSIWKLLLHPSINQEKWSRTEHLNLKRIATYHNMQDWDRIAKELGTGRSGYQCFIYCRSNITHPSQGQKWTTAEEEYLKSVVKFFREDSYIPWGKVATALGKRTKIQAYNKYRSLTLKNNIKFLPEEDAVILSYYDRHQSFHNMATYIPGRSSIQLQNRYNKLTKMTSFSFWTDDDDRALVQIMRHLNAGFSKAAQYFPGKDRIALRSRYKTIMRWMAKNPDADIGSVPRRASHRYLNKLDIIPLEEAIQNLNNRIGKYSGKKTYNKRQKLMPFSSHEDLDKSIINIFVQSILKEEEQVSHLQDQEVTLPDNSIIPHVSLKMSNLHSILTLLNASLDKNKLLKSQTYSMYASLGEVTQDINLTRVSTYSRKQSIQSVRPVGNPEVWGVNKLGALRHVLPPNFTTLTTFRVLLTYNVMEKVSGCDSINIGLMARRNVIFKEAYNKFKERMTTLFLWSIKLSNVPPMIKSEQNSEVDECEDKSEPADFDLLRNC